MASYTTSLRLVQPATGEYSGTWGTQVNNGLTALVDSAVAGTANITMVAADYTLSNANGAADEARAMFLVLGGSPGAPRNVICPAVSKLYFVTNNTGFAQTVKTASGTGISVPNGASMTLRCDGTNVVVAQNYFGSLTLGAALPIASGGTGSTSTTYCSLTANVTGTLPVGNGGTGAATFTANNVLLGNGTSAFQVVAPGTAGNVLTSNGTTWTSAALSAVSTISFGTTGLTPSTATSGAVTVAGTLSVANGGTGLTTFTAANRIPYASGATTLTTSAGLTFDGTNFATTGTATAGSFIPTSSTVPTNGMYLPAANTLGWGVNSTAKMQLNSSGQLLLGTNQTASVAGYSPTISCQNSFSTEPAAVFRSNTLTAATPTVVAWNMLTTGDNAFVGFGTENTYAARGSITYNRAGGLVAYNTTSDYRAKDIFGPVQNPGATIDALKVYEGRMKGATQSRPMLVAHEAQAHAPYAVSGVKDEMNEDGTPRFQQIDVSSLVPLLLAEIQSLRARVAALEVR